LEGGGRGLFEGTIPPDASREREREREGERRKQPVTHHQAECFRIVTAALTCSVFN